MGKKKRSEYKYPPEKMKEWRDNWKSKLTSEQIEERKRKQREFNQKYQERRRHENVRRRSAQPPIPDRKVCGRCKTEKSKEEFRIRTEKRSEPYFDYLNNVCKICDAELARISYKKTKEKNREKNRLKAIEYYNKNKDRIHATEKERRKKPAYKKYVKQYYDKNKERILKQHKVVCDKAKDELRDWYVVGKIAQKKHKSIREEVKQNKELIEIKRLQITLKRLTKNANRTTDKHGEK